MAFMRLKSQKRRKMLFFDNVGNTFKDLSVGDKTNSKRKLKIAEINFPEFKKEIKKIKNIFKIN